MSSGDSDIRFADAPTVALPRLQTSTVARGRGPQRLVRWAVSAAAVLAMLAIAVMVAVYLWPDVRTYGTLEPGDVYPVRAIESGVVVRLHVNSGDSVREGQLLANLDTLHLSTSLQAARRERARLLHRLAQLRDEAEIAVQRGALLVERSTAAVFRSEAQLREARVVYGIGRSEPAPGAHSGYDEARAALLEAEADLRLNALEERASRSTAHQEAILLEQIAELEEQALSLTERLRRMGIYAPADGVVLTERVESRMHDLLEQGEILMEVGSTERWSAVLMLGGEEVRRVQLGQEAKVELSVPRSRDKVVMSGTVRHIAAEAATSGATATAQFRVVVDLDTGAMAGADVPDFRRGYRVRASIRTRPGSPLQPILEVMDRL